MLELSDLCYVPYITQNLILVSEFDKDNIVYFEFQSNNCYVKSQASN